MTTAKLSQGARTQLAGAAALLNGLANGAYVALGTITHANSGKVPLDCKVELAVSPNGTVSSNKQVILFAKTSGDGATWSTGPESGTSTTDENMLIRIGAVPVSTSGVPGRLEFSIAMAMAGMLLPYATKLIAKNETGVTLSTTNNDLYTQDYSGDLT